MKVLDTHALNDAYQRDIIRNAPRSVIYYVGQHGDVTSSRYGVIPDTPEARKRAVDKHKAIYFDRYAFHRFNLDGTPGNHKFGDFYCQLIPNNKGMSIFDTMNPLIDFFISLGFFSIEYCTLLYLGPGPLGAHILGLSIPSSAFEMEDGGVILPALYKTFFERMSIATAGSNVKVRFNQHVDAANKRIFPGIYAVPFRLEEIKTAASLDSLVSKERDDYKWKLPLSCMNTDIIIELKERARAQTAPATSPVWSQPPQPECLSYPPAGFVPETKHLEHASKCARKLLAWISERRIVEFGRRNALRALGESGKGGGVADALSILRAGNFIQQCPSSSRGFARRPSPWYLVNPD